MPDEEMVRYTIRLPRPLADRVEGELDAFSNDNARFQHIVHEYFKHQDRLDAAYAADRAVPGSTEG